MSHAASLSNTENVGTRSYGRRWVFSVGAVAFACIAVTACGGSDDEAQPPPSALTAADAKNALTKFIDTDDCDLMTDEYIVEAWGGSTPAEARASCEKDTDKGLQRGQYEVATVRVAGQKATVHLQLDAGGQRIYTLAAEDGRWRIDAFRETKRAVLGKTLLFEDAYEENGEPKNVALKIRLVSYDSRPAAPRYAVLEPGRRFVRFRLRVTNAGDPTTLSVEDIAAVDGSGQRFRGNGQPFEPSLGNNVVELQPNETVSGYVSMQVPKDAKLRELRAAPQGAGGAVPLVWRLP